MLRRFLVISLQPRAPSGQFYCVQNLVAILTKATSDYLPQAPYTTFVFKQIDTQASITTCSILWPIKNQSSYLRQVTLWAQISRGHLCAVYRMSSLWTTSVSSDNTSTCRSSNVLRGITIPKLPSLRTCAIRTAPNFDCVPRKNDKSIPILSCSTDT